ncbi:MAG TPA: hypothetical protein VKZ93_02895, partial [Arenibacter sp.]|nr:hypothetical protein [Arenibacter sp.]
MPPAKDLADIHHLITDMFDLPKTAEEWEPYKLTEEQIAHYHENGYLSGIKLLEERQVDILREELDQIMDPQHPRHHLFYEFHSNESQDTDSVLFHSLGHWRISEGFHDVLWNPAFIMAAHQLLENRPLRFWHDQLFYKPAR